MKKIAVFPGVFLTGGVESVIMNILEKSNSDEYSYDFFVPRPYDIALDSKLVKYHSKFIQIPQISEVGVIKYIKKVSKILKSTDKYDIIHVHSIHSGVLSSIAGFVAGIKQRVYHVHNTDDPSLNTIKFKKIYRAVMKFLINKFNNTYVACGEQASKYIYYKRKIKKSKVFIFNNSIDLHKFYPISISDFKKRKEQSTNEKLIIGNAARFTPVKNQKFLINLANEINKEIDCELMLAGDGETIDECKELSKQYNLQNKVKFLGVITDMKLFYDKIDVFVLPSFHEGLPVSIIEAQACGVPSLLSDTITSEVDFKLNLVDYESLDSSLNNWKDKIYNLSKKRIFDFETIKNRFDELNYNLDNMQIQIEKMYSNRKRVEFYDKNISNK